MIIKKDKNYIITNFQVMKKLFFEIKDTRLKRLKKNDEIY